MHFKSPEHALKVAYYILATRIEPCNVIQKLIEKNTGVKIHSASDLSPHDWHTQSIWIINLAKRVTGNKIGFHVLQASFGDIMSNEVRESLFEVSQWINKTTDSRERLITDMIVTHMLRGRPTQRFIADQFCIPQANVFRAIKKYRDMINVERDHADAILWNEFKTAGLVLDGLD